MEEKNAGSSWLSGCRLEEERKKENGVEGRERELGSKAMSTRVFIRLARPRRTIGYMAMTGIDHPDRRPSILIRRGCPELGRQYEQG